jgi:high-affinity nickel permease
VDHNLSVIAVLTGGLLLGLQHALDADHLAAVSTIVSERKSLLSASIVGGLWGIGHTVSLLVAGLAVILLHVRVSDRVAGLLEFCVALMLIGLGINALLRLQRASKLHWHTHKHGSHTHSHPHLHEPGRELAGSTHHQMKVGLRPLIVGLVHGLAGSAALMLMVLSTVASPVVGLAYILIFGLGSIGGMMVMSSLFSLPFHLTANKFTRANFAVRLLAGCFSLGFGLFLAYHKTFVEGLWR